MCYRIKGTNEWVEDDNLEVLKLCIKMDAEPEERKELKESVNVWYCCCVCAEKIDKVGAWGYRVRGKM